MLGSAYSRSDDYGDTPNNSAPQDFMPYIYAASVGIPAFLCIIGLRFAIGDRSDCCEKKKVRAAVIGRRAHMYRSDRHWINEDP